MSSTGITTDQKLEDTTFPTEQFFGHSTWIAIHVEDDTLGIVILDSELKKLDADMIVFEPT